MYAAGEALAAAFWPDLGNGIAGATLAFVALAAAVAGPARAVVRDLRHARRAR